MSDRWVPLMADKALLALARDLRRDLTQWLGPRPFHGWNSQRYSAQFQFRALQVRDECLRRGIQPSESLDRYYQPAGNEALIQRLLDDLARLAGELQERIGTARSEER